MNKYIDYFLNYFKAEKDTSKSKIHKYGTDLERLPGYLSSNTAMH